MIARVKVALAMLTLRTERGLHTLCRKDAPPFGD